MVLAVQLTVLLDVGGQDVHEARPLEPATLTGISTPIELPGL
jgi:hypothetical protein